MNTLDEHPQRLECHGRELATLIDDVRGRGGIVEGMTHACPGIYRLAIYWPPPQQFPLAVISNGERHD
jgi:hypothetical protein